MFLWEWTFFDKIWAWEQCVFLRMDVFDKIWVKELLFRKSRVSIDFFYPKYRVVLTELTFFRPNMGLSAVDFSWKIWEKMTWYYSFFERMDFFLPNMGLSVFLKNRRIFDNIWHENSDFLLENRKKGHPIDFFVP